MKSTPEKEFPPQAGSRSQLRRGQSRESRGVGRDRLENCTEKMQNRESWMRKKYILNEINRKQGSKNHQELLLLVKSTGYKT